MKTHAGSGTPSTLLVREELGFLERQNFEKKVAQLGLDIQGSL